MALILLPPISNSSVPFILHIKLLDATTKLGKTGLTASSTGLTIVLKPRNYILPDALVFKQADGNIEGISSIGDNVYEEPSEDKIRFAEVDAVLMPGVYELHMPLLAFVAGVGSDVYIAIHGVSGLDEADYVQPMPLYDASDTASIVAGLPSDIRNDVQQLLQLYLPSRPTEGEGMDFPFYMALESDPKTGATGLTDIDLLVQVSTDNQEFVDTQESASEIGFGWYYITLTDDEMDAFPIALRAMATGALTMNTSILTQPSNPPPG